MTDNEESQRMTDGKCFLCDAVITKSGAVKHFKSCLSERIKMLESKRKSESKKFFHLLVEGSYNPEYWMHIIIQGDTRLEKLDSFLRDTWLECCGHLSAFTINNRRFESEYADDYPVELMTIGVGRLFRVGLKFLHEYDFGSTTGLTLKVVSEWNGKFKGDPIQLIAQNEPPEIPCDKCGKKATQVCAQCSDGGGGWLCDACSKTHECGEEMLLPIVNSPRVGVCGYTGEGGI